MTSANQINTENVLLPFESSNVFEQYEFKGWLITIENYMGTDDLIGFATPTKYAHLLDSSSYYLIDEIIKNVPEIKYEDLNYLVAEPDDVMVNFCAGVDTKSPSHVLDYMVNRIIIELGIERPATIVLKQINRKSIKPKVGKRQTGFLHVAWASLVKERDKKCTECGSVYDLHAHHVKSYKSHPELRNDVNNGITLCGGCHRKWHRENGKL